MKFSTFKDNFISSVTEVKVYNILLLIALGILVTTLVRFMIIGGVVVSEIDEVPYFNSSKVFAHQFSLKSTEVVEEGVSKITESDWYGPGYPLLYGSFRILLGNTDKSFVYTNLIFLCIILISMSKFRIGTTDRKWLWLIVLLCPSIMNYTFLFMPVTLDLAFASILMFLLVKIGLIFPSGNIKKSGLVFLLAVLLASLFKQNFLFFSFGLLFFSENWKWFLFWLLGAMVLFISVMIYNSYFLAPVYVTSFKNSIDYLVNFQIGKFLNEIGSNFVLNLKQLKTNRPVDLVYYVPYYMALLPALILLLNLKQKNRLIFAMVAISGLTLLSYFMLYSTKWSYFVRISIPLVLINCLSVLFFNNKIKVFLKYSILSSFIISLPLTINEVIKNQNTKKRNYDYVNYEMPDFRQITSFLDKNKINTILIDEDFYNMYGFEQFLVALPIEYDNNIIRYTVNYRLKNKFELLHKLKVDYALTPKPVDIPNTTLVNKNDYYYLYKFTD